MIKRLTLVFAAILLCGLQASAQYCGFDYLNQKLKINDPGYAQRLTQDDVAWRSQMLSGGNSLVIYTATDTTYEIPVVIHVMHTGGAIGSQYNPTDAQLTGMISYLNASYAATWAAYPSTTTGGTKVPLRFILAKRTPNCTPTTGILRYNLDTNAAYVANGVNSSGTTGIDDEILKDHERWPTNEYYNIYIVNKINGNDGSSGVYTAGFAYFPNAGERYDGTVMLARSAVAGEETLPHEIGHAMNLYHVFEGNDPAGTGANNCPPAETGTTCLTLNDRVCDTEPMMQSVFNCPTGTNPCTNAAWLNTQHNFMDYSSCKDRFTPGQRTRMIAALLQYRGGLLSSLGGTALPASNTMTAACIPTSLNPTNNLNAGPRKVVLNDMTAVTAGGYNDDADLVYLDRTCQQQANLNVGQTYTITVTTGNNENLRVFIDYDNDGSFSATEQVVTRSGSGAQSASFTVPTTGVVTCSAIRMRVVSDRTTSILPTACGPLGNGQAEDYSVILKGPSNSASVRIALTTGTNPSCVNNSLTFTATPGGTPGTGVIYKWYINGIAVTAATAATTFTTSSPTNGSLVTARIFYTGPCGADSALSNAVQVLRSTAIAPSVSIALTSGSNPGCSGQSLTFTATPVNGGTTPTYTWRRNGVAIAGTTNTNVFTSTTLNSSDVITAVLNSSLSCANPLTAVSNGITLTFSSTLTTTATITQTSGSNPTCSGRAVTFRLTATNPGTAPVYSWLINSAPTGSTGTTFTTSTLNNNDTVQALVISNSPCIALPVVLSNKIVMTVNISDTPTVAATIIDGTNPGCTDSALTFIATTTSTTATGFIWYLNGSAVATTPTYSSTSFSTGDQVYVAMLTGPGCHLYDTAISQVVTVSRNAVLNPPVISFIGNMLVSSVAPVQWYGPSGIIAGATTQSYHPAGPGLYYARATNGGCPSASSNVLQVSLLTIGSYNLDAVQIYPNPTTGKLNLDWGATKVNATINIFTTTGQRVMQQHVVGATRQTMDLSSLSAGIYFVMIRDADGQTGTVRITLTK